ncbi:MAG: virulence RhuM family protein [Paludibacteraceae bacterium]|nr:virulence RhuM family protein [Paludibacteraceae bacterium]
MALELYHQNEDGVVIYRTEDNTLQLDVQLAEETVWLAQQQMAVLFDTTKQNVSLHINNIFKEGELDKISVVKDYLTTAADGKKYRTTYYNLDVIISVGYRVKSKRGTQFRQWALKVIKDYMLRGYAINQQMLAMEERIDRQLHNHTEQIQDLQKKVNFFVRTSLPPHQGIFYDGQIFDAYTFINDRIREATTRIILIDNYIDDSVLTILSKRADKVATTIYTKKPSAQLQLDIQKHNAQYPPIEVITFDRSHDRFLCIDETVYHLGASIKDLGKKWFAFCRMEMPTTELLQKIQTTYNTPPS